MVNTGHYTQDTSNITEERISEYRTSPRQPEVRCFCTPAIWCGHSMSLSGLMRVALFNVLEFFVPALEGSWHPLWGVLCLEVGVHIIIPYCLRQSTVGVTVTAYSPVEFRDTYLIGPEQDTRLLNNVFLVSFVTVSLLVKGLIRARSGVHTAVLLKMKSSGKRSCVSGYFLTFHWMLVFLSSGSSSRRRVT
jgi:hypothetical protein